MNPKYIILFMLLSSSLVISPLICTRYKKGDCKSRKKAAEKYRVKGTGCRE
jgi:hypothetical protein